MSGLSSLPVIVQNICCFWALVICLPAIADVILFLRQKRLALCGLSAAVFASAFFLMQVIRSLSEFRLHGTREPAALFICSLPYAVHLSFLVLLTLAAAFLYAGSQRWEKAHISLDSIKESIDGLPAGICFYLDDGRCVLINHRMNEIAYALFGRDLQNGAVLYEAVREAPVRRLPDGGAVSFRSNVIEAGGTRLHELIADDISELYEKTEQLRLGNERARRLSESMKAYGLTIDDTVRRQEILQAKINIHDGMNRMLLAARNSLSQDTLPGSMAETIEMWKNCAALLRSEASGRHGDNVVSDINALSRVTGVETVWHGSPAGADARALQLFVLAAREAMTNAAKHGGAQHLYIDTGVYEGSLNAAFTNDGRLPEGSVSETGGLRDLRTRIEADGGSMKVSAYGRFRLDISIPTGGDSDAI